MSDQQANDDIVFLPIEEAHRKIGEWMWYIHISRLNNKKGKPTNDLMVTLYKEMDLNYYTKEYSFKGIVEIFYYQTYDKYFLD